jgi:hypothetical protein
MTYALVAQYEPDYGPPEVFGPYESVEEAQSAAEDVREHYSLPREATADNNDAWTEAGWYFGIVELRRA